MQPANSAISSSSWRSELLYVGLLVGMSSVQLLASGAIAVLQRHMWLDEIHTYTLVSDPSFSHAMQALKDGVDYNPPTLYLFQRLNTWYWGEVSELSLRGFSLGCVMAAVIGMYLCLRRMVAPWGAMAAAATFWIHPLVAEQTYEARVYAPWCAAIVWYAFFHLRTCDSPRRAVSGCLMCALAVVIGTIHYFGILSLGLYWTAYLVVNRPALRQLRWGALSTGCAMLALAACVPFYLQQKQALSIATWIQPPSVRSSLEFLGMVVPIFCLVVCGVMAWYQFRRRWEKGERERTCVNWQPLAGLLGLVGMLLFLIAFSYGVQSVLVPRYAIVAAIGFAAATAWLVSDVPRPLLMAATCSFFGLGLWQLSDYVDLVQQRDQDRLGIIALLREQQQTAPIVFESRLDLYPVAHYAHDLAARSSLLDFEDGQLQSFSRMRVVERDVGRRFQRHYPDQFRLTRYDELKQLERFFLVVLPNHTQAGPDYANWEIHRLGERVFELVPRAGRLPHQLLDFLPVNQ